MYPFDLPQNFGYIKSYFQRAMLRSCLHTVDAAACVSHSTLARLEAFEPGIALIKATVIPNAVEPMQAASSKVPPRPYAEPFLLCVAQHRRNKQIPLLLKIFVELLHTESVDRSAQLIVVGIPGPETHAIHKCIQRYGLQARVRLVMGLTDEQMQAHYQHCEVLIAPSSIEGFGLPIVEGLMAGCRVVCSDIAAFREVGNASCTYVPLDLDVVHRFAEAIMQSLGKPKPQPVAPVGFSLSAVSSEYVRLYQKLNEQHVRPRIPGNIAFATTKTRTGAEA
jgi:glycosyltransferase involved in cell wall biosynthesis